MFDSLGLSTVLAFALVAGVCILLQLRVRSVWTALGLSVFLAPLVFVWSEPLFYSPRNFVLLVLPRLPGFLWNSVRVYPAVFLKLLPVPVVVGILLGRRKAFESLELS
jgi:hypothetical protein